MVWWKRAVGLTAPDASWYAPGSQYGGAGEGLTLTYLGTAGFVLEQGGHTVVLDPYVSRPGMLTSFTQPLIPDAALIRKVIPKANDVLVGHAHYDHVLDAPVLCQQTGARLIGSRAVTMVGRAAGLPEYQLRETAGHEEIASGNWRVRGLPSRHGRVFGRIPIPGDITEPPPWPPRIRDLRHGLVLNWLVEANGLKVLHVDSADYIPAELAGIKADVICLCAIGRQYRPHYVEEVIGLLKPRWVVPCHWDTMMTPLDAPPEMIPGVDLPGFMDEVRAAGAEPLLMPIRGQLTFASEAGE